MENRHSVTLGQRLKPSPSRDKFVAQVLFEVIKLRDGATAAHSLLMAYYSYLLAEKFDRPRRDAYYVAGLVHDVGKIGMGDGILKGSSLLTPSERTSLKDHVISGGSLLGKFGFSEIIVNIALYHHERYDGSGYSQGLAGTAIPLCARIAAIADTYSTLVEGRKYKASVSSSQALDIMCADSHLFDPLMLEWFFLCVNKLGTIETSTVHAFYDYWAAH